MKATLAVLLLVLFAIDTEAPIPPCAPYSFINKIVESGYLRWLFHDLPGHPVPPCRYEEKEDAPLEFRSLPYFFISKPDRIIDELKTESKWWTEKGIPRMNRRFWRMFDQAFIDQQHDGLSKKDLKDRKKRLNRLLKLVKVMRKKNSSYKNAVEVYP